jgi:arsenate reductase
VPEGIVGESHPEVLFVCVHNAGRSQMAAGLLTLRSRGRIDVRSAGSAPADEIDPNAIVARDELDQRVQSLIGRLLPRD